MRRLLAAFILLSLFSAAHAQGPNPPMAKSPEQMLPADCLLYLRYDGHEPHRQAYEKTALARAMKEGLSEFFDHAFSQLFSLAGDILPRGNPKKAEEARPVVNRFLDYLWTHGFALGVEMDQNSVQATFVFPRGADKKNRTALDGFFRFAADAIAAPVNPVNLDGRKGHGFALGDVRATWWTEGEHVIVTAGVRPPRRALEVVTGRRPNVAGAAWYAELARFKRYETDIRGRLHLEPLVDWLATFDMGPPGLGNFKDRLAREMLLRHLGLTGLKDLTFHLGFDGKYQRSTVRLGVDEPGKRTGLLRLLTSGPIAFDPDKLPRLPPDSDYVSVRHIDWNSLYSYVRTTYGLLSLSRLLDQGELPETLPDLDRLLGLNFRKDFLDQLDTRLVTYGAHSEGPFLLGQGFAVKVKDAAKVRTGLDAITKALAQAGETLAAQKRTFRGEETYVFHRFFLPVTVAVHKDWLVCGFFPQPVQGFILRSDEKYRAWKSPPELHEVLVKERKEKVGGKLLSVSVSDPRPVVEIGLALLPTFVHLFNQSVGTQVLDVSKIPNAQAVKEWLFPNVAMVYDDGKAIRWENHYSINEPDELLLFSLVPLAAEFGFFRVPFGWLAPPRPKVGMKGLKGDPLLPPQKVPDKEEADPKKLDGPPDPKPLAPAKVTEEKGAVMVNVTLSREVFRTTYKTVSETHYKVVGDRMIPYTVTKVVQVFAGEKVPVEFALVADGKRVRVVDKLGKPVDPRKLLTGRRQILVFREGGIDPIHLDDAADDLLILVITRPPAYKPS